MDCGQGVDASDSVTLVAQYWLECGAEGIMRPGPALHRVIPAQQAVKTEFILPYDDVKPLIRQAKFFELRHCICRKSQDVLGIRDLLLNRSPH